MKRSVKAPHGEKMIEVKVRFWTNDIGAKKGEVVPKHGWARGVVRMERNDTHGTTGDPNEKFNSLMELPHAIERLLIKQGIVLYSSPNMRKYLRDGE